MPHYSPRVAAGKRPDSPAITISNLPIELQFKLKCLAEEFRKSMESYKRNPNYVSCKKWLIKLIKELERHSKRIDAVYKGHIDNKRFSLVDEGEQVELYISDDDGRGDTHDLIFDKTPSEITAELRQTIQLQLEHLRTILAGLPIRERKSEKCPTAIEVFSTGVAEVYRLAGGNPTVPGHDETYLGYTGFLAFSREVANLAGYRPHSDRAWADILRPYLRK